MILTDLQIEAIKNDKNPARYGWKTMLLDLIEENKMLRETKDWYDTHHRKCEDICGAECVPSEKEVEKFVKTDDWRLGIRVFDIVWETDGEEVELPSTVVIPGDTQVDEIADYLFYEYDWLVGSFDYEDE